MKNDNVHDFFHNVSRLTIILPIIIIAVGIILKPRPKILPQVTTNVYKISPTEQLVNTAAKKKNISINLTGPFICSLVSQSSYTGKIYIKNKNIRADLFPTGKNATISSVLNGDCIYKWENGVSTGTKLCNISQYVGILDTMSNFGALDAQTLMTLVTQFGNANGATNLPKDIPEATCKKDPVEDGVFTIPKTIRFQSKNASSSAN